MTAARAVRAGATIAARREARAAFAEPPAPRETLDGLAGRCWPAAPSWARSHLPAAAVRWDNGRVVAWSLRPGRRVDLGPVATPATVAWAVTLPPLAAATAAVALTAEAVARALRAARQPLVVAMVAAGWAPPPSGGDRPDRAAAAPAPPLEPTVMPERATPDDQALALLREVADLQHELFRRDDDAARAYRAAHQAVYGSGLAGPTRRAGPQRPPIQRVMLALFWASVGVGSVMTLLAWAAAAATQAGVIDPPPTPPPTTTSTTAADGVWDLDDWSKPPAEEATP